jgi:hypothetical protein
MHTRDRLVAHSAVSSTTGKRSDIWFWPSLSYYSNIWLVPSLWSKGNYLSFTYKAAFIAV